MNDDTQTDQQDIPEEDEQGITGEAPPADEYRLTTR